MNVNDLVLFNLLKGLKALDKYELTGSAFALQEFAVYRQYISHKETVIRNSINHI